MSSDLLIVLSFLGSAGLLALLAHYIQCWATQANIEAYGARRHGLTRKFIQGHPWKKQIWETINRIDKMNDLHKTCQATHNFGDADALFIEILTQKNILARMIRQKLGPEIAKIIDEAKRETDSSNWMLSKLEELSPESLSARENLNSAEDKESLKN